jgi:hypothetical protein
MTDETLQLRTALRTGRTGSAARLARAAARAGGSGRAARGDVALLARKLFDHPDDRAHFARLCDRLAATGPGNEVLRGACVATNAGRAGVDAWLRLVVALFGAGAATGSVVPRLRLAVGRILAAADSCRRALELAPGAPGPRLTAALLYARRGDREAARTLFAQAGAPAVVGGLACAVGVAVL